MLAPFFCLELLSFLLVTLEDIIISLLNMSFTRNNESLSISHEIAFNYVQYVRAPCCSEKINEYCLLRNRFNISFCSLKSMFSVISCVMWILWAFTILLHCQAEFSYRWMARIKSESFCIIWWWKEQEFLSRLIRDYSLHFFLQLAVVWVDSKVVMR